MVSMEYKVRLDAFEGPLDLLLFLIRRAEVDIHDIPIAHITQQYLGFLEGVTDGSEAGGSGTGVSRRIDIEQAGEFLVMAATLMEIKSRMLGGLKTGGDEGGAERASREAEIDPRAELVRQLLEYKRFRDASDRLERWKNEWEHRYPTARVVMGQLSAAELAAEIEAEGQTEARVDVDDLTLIDLVEAFARVVESVDFSRVGEHRVVVDDTPVEVHGERILERLRQGAPGATIEFRSLFVQRTRGEMIGIFLAILEMVKQQRIVVEQEARDGGGAGEIVLRLGEAGAAAMPATGTPA